MNPLGNVQHWVQSSAKTVDVHRFPAYLALTKPRVTLMVVLTAAAGFYMASPGLARLPLLLHVILGTMLIAAGTAGLNQFLESDSDGRMRRTSQRPLPARRIEEQPALFFATGLVLAGAGYLGLLVNPATALLGVLTSALYLFLYTPLKTRTPACTAVGALPGAMPPLMGWAAVRNPLEIEGLALFALLFLWQFPHFYAIAWMYRDDYERGGFRMLPIVDPTGKRTARHILAHTYILAAAASLPFFLGMAGWVYLAGSAALAGLPLRAAYRLRRDRSRRSASLVLRASIIYLPLVLILLIADKV